MDLLWISLCISCDYPVDSVVPSSAGSSCYHRSRTRAIIRTESLEALAVQAFLRPLTYLTKRITKKIGRSVPEQISTSGMREAVKTGQPAGWSAQVDPESTVNGLPRSWGLNQSVSACVGACVQGLGEQASGRQHGSETPVRPGNVAEVLLPMPWVIQHDKTPLRAGIRVRGPVIRPADRLGPRLQEASPCSTAVLDAPFNEPAIDASMARPDMRVLLWRFAGRSHTWLRFGQPFAMHRLDKQRRIAMFAPGAICCRVQWVANAYGPIFWQLMILQAGDGTEAVQRVRGVAPGAHILLQAQGERRVKDMLEWLDDMAAAGVDLARVSPAYWRTVHNRLAARMALPPYTAERQGAYSSRRRLLTGGDPS